MIKILICVISILIGLILGTMFTIWFVTKESLQGKMYYNEDNPDYMTCGISMDIPPEELRERSYVMLKVVPQEKQRL